jgi:pimeloyl-ACP methyl ester carboxylesterase
MLSPAVFQLKNLKWLLVAFGLLFLNCAVLWLWANFLTLRYQRYLMYLGYLPADSRSKVHLPQIRPPFNGHEVVEGSEDYQSLATEIPSDYNMVDSFYLKSSDGTQLHAHFYKFPSSGRYSTVKNSKLNYKHPNIPHSVPTILFFHGTSGNIGHRVGYAHTLSSLCQCNVMLINCRGYGLSGGHAHSKGIRQDSQAALDYLLNEKRMSESVDPSKIFVLGQSMGGAIAIDLAMRNIGKIKGMIIDNTFTRINDLVPEVLPSFSHLRDYITEDWDSLGAIEAKAGHPNFPHCLFLIGDSDELIDSKNGKALFRAAQEATNTSKEATNASKNTIDVTLLLFKYGYHVHTFRDPFYFDTISQFVNEHV